MGNGARHKLHEDAKAAWKKMCVCVCVSQFGLNNTCFLCHTVCVCVCVCVHLNNGGTPQSCPR